MTDETISASAYGLMAGTSSAMVTHDPAEAPLPCPAHCWHLRDRRVTVLTTQGLDVCCQCGVERGVVLEARIPEGHGRFCPEREHRWRPA